MNIGNLYLNTAELYDLDNRNLLSDDLSMCLKCVNETQGDILEIACGTGRITIPVLEHISKNTPNRFLTAFDLSDAMLAVFQRKLEQIRHRNLFLDKQNMIDFSYNKKFSLIILVWRAFQFLLSDADVDKCLKNIKYHLEDNGIFLLSVFIPKKTYAGDWLDKEVISYEIIDPQSGSKVTRKTKNLSYDEVLQQIVYSSTYNISTPDGQTDSYTDIHTCRYYYPDQIKSLLLKYGFQLIWDESTHTDLFLASTLTCK